MRISYSEEQDTRHLREVFRPLGIDAAIRSLLENEDDPVRMSINIDSDDAARVEIELALPLTEFEEEWVYFRAPLSELIDHLLSLFEGVEIVPDDRAFLLAQADDLERLAGVIRARVAA